MSRREFAATPSWLRVVALLGAVTTVVVAWHVGIRAALATAGIALVAWAADRALPDDEPVAEAGADDR